MHESMSSQKQELICINVDKVFDWIVKEMTFDISPTGAITFPGLGSIPSPVVLTGATVKCKVTPATTNPIVILDREDRLFTIDGKKVCLQQLAIQKNFLVTLMVTLQNGTMLTSTPVPVTRCEQVTLCAPKGTDVEITFTDLDCFVCTTGTLSLGPTPGTIVFSSLSITISVCQSIQSTFPVTVEFVADYCEPRADLPFACPPPTRPNQCSVIFPSGDKMC